MTRSDVLIVGAGPAGGIAAVALSRRGLRVVVLERECLPRDKLCSGVISPRSVAALSAVGLLGIVDESSVGGVRRTHMALRDAATTLHHPDTHLRFVSRPLFDAALIREAVGHGAMVIDGAKALSLDPQAGTVTTANGGVYTGDVVIGADGARGICSRALNGTLPRHGLAMEFRLPADGFHYPVDTERIEFTLSGGYHWAFPKSDGRMAVGGGTFDPASFAELRGAVGSYSRSLGIEPPSTISGHPLPAFPVSTMALGRVLLAGDAAGLVDPLLGEGIPYALWSGLLAADTAGRHLSGDALALSRYPALIWSRILRFQRPIRRLHGLRATMELLGLTRLAHSDSATRAAWRFLIDRAPSAHQFSCAGSSVGSSDAVITAPPISTTGQ